MQVESRARASLGISFVVAATAFTLRDLLSTDDIPAYRDILKFFVPLKYYLAAELKRGELPLWNPYIQMGSPFLATWQTGVLYPPSILLLLPFPLGVNAFLLAHYVAAAVGCWLFLRERRLSVSAASLGAVTFVIGGYLVSLMNIMNHLQAAAWSPWVFFWWQRYRNRPSASPLAALVASLTLCVLGGAPEIVLMTLAVVAASTAYEAALHFRRFARLAVTFGVAFGLTLGLCGFQLLPTFEYFGESVRKTGLSLQEITAWSLQPVSLLQLLIPHSWSPAISGVRNEMVPILESRPPWIQSLYLGLVPLCVGIAGAAAGRERLLWGGLVAAALVLALGHYTPVFPAVHAALPGVFGRFRFPEKFIFMAHVGAAVLIAEGAEVVFRREPVAERVVLVVSGTFVAIAGGLLALRWLRGEDYLRLVLMLRGGGPADDNLVRLALDVAFKCERLILVLATFAALVWLRRKALVGDAIFVTLLLALAAADLSSAEYGLNGTTSWARLTREPLLVDPKSSDARDGYLFHYQTTAVRVTGGPPEPIAGFEQWFPTIESWNLEDAAIRMWRACAMNQGMLHGLRDIGGSDGFHPSASILLQTTLSILPREKAVSLLGLYGTSYLIGPTPLSVGGLEAVDQPKPAIDYAYRITDRSPFARVVSRLHVAKSDVDGLNHLIRPDFRPQEEAVVSELPAGWRDTSIGGDSAGSVQSVTRSSERVTVKVASDREAFLVLNDSYSPGWKARVDGAPSKIYRANVFVRGLVVPPGDHSVELVYRPASFRIGVAISIASLLAAMALFVRIRATF